MINISAVYFVIERKDSKMSEEMSEVNQSQMQIVESSNDSVSGVNSETLKKKTTKSSKFREFFELIDEKDNISGACKICAKSKKIVKIKMKNRNTSGLRKHLSATHKKEFHQLFPQKVPSTNIGNFFKSAKGPVSSFILIKLILIFICE